MNESVRAELDLLKKQLLNLHELFVATQQQLMRLTDFVSAESTRLAEGLEQLDDHIAKLDAHLRNHIKACTGADMSAPPIPEDK